MSDEDCGVYEADTCPHGDDPSFCEKCGKRAPKERPILFSAPMVLAVLAMRKSQTRRVIQPAGLVKVDGGGHPFTDRWDEAEGHAWRRDIRCPYGAVGDRLWVKEAFRLRADQDHKPPRDDAWKDGAWYEATGNGETPSGCGGGIGRLRPSIFMPRWASRITLEITEVRVQRLQEITEEDAKAEGVDPLTHMFSGEPARDDYRAGFEIIWRNINGAASWDGNPWVWCLSFKRVP